MMRIVCLSDTHTFGKQIVVPDGDVVVHAGDITLRGTQDETKAALKWLDSLPHKAKILCAGNHDFYFDANAPSRYRSWSLERDCTPEQLLREFPTVTYLQDAGAEIQGVKFYGSPWQPWFYDWAFNLPRDGAEIEAKWALIPSDTTVLVVHSPPFGILDVTESGEHAGCSQLALRIPQLKSLRLCVFGHIHEGYGRLVQDGVTFANASICDEEYRPVNDPIVIDL